ncbi:hypothetical protein YC2023_057710 [Brassica napus]
MEKTSQDVQVHPNQMDARGKDKDACGTVRMVRQIRMHVRLWFLHDPSKNVELVGEDGLWFGRLGRLDVVPAEAPIGTHAERLGQSDRYGRMNEPRSNCSERPDLHAGWLQWTDPRTRAHQTCPSVYSEEHVPRYIPRKGVPRYIPRKMSLGIFRGRCPSVYSERFFINRSIDGYISKNASIDRVKNIINFLGM